MEEPIERSELKDIDSERTHRSEKCGWAKEIITAVKYIWREIITSKVIKSWEMKDSEDWEAFYKCSSRPL